ncbi:MAG: hypothetical protein LLG93_13735, partial [Deltaproteobacteria bacterium]|nr:hypothetical protein [Deltaproteobacteria bacterium]
MVAGCTGLLSAVPPTQWQSDKDQSKATCPGIQSRIRGFGLPFFFEENRGQTDPSVRFYLRRPGYSLFLTDQDLVFALGVPRGVPKDPDRRLAAVSSLSPEMRTAVVRMGLVGATTKPLLFGERQESAQVRQIRGRDPKQAESAISAYGRVRYWRVYPGIDLTLEGRDGRLRYDLHVGPQADPGRIRLRFAGIQSLALDREGNLVVETPAGRMIQRAPQIYQVVEGRRVPLRGGFVLHKQDEVGFEVAGRDPSAPLVIDPEIVFATYLGGSHLEGSRDPDSDWNVSVAADGA